MSTRKRRLQRRGYVLVFLTLSAVFLIGMVGLAVDVGRMYIVKNEAQSYADSVALFAARELDGTLSGITAAQGMAACSPKTWHMGTQAFTGTTVRFSTSADGPWSVPADNSGAASMRAVQVIAHASLPLYFLPPIVRSTTSQIAASGVGYNSGFYAPRTGVFPFAVLSRRAPGLSSSVVDDASDAFGLHVGTQYTLRWDNKNDFPCAGDTDIPGSFDWDYVGSIGQSASGVNNAIDGEGADILLRQGYYDIVMSNGDKASEVKHIEDRVNDDADHLSTTFLSYHGDGRRVVICPITDATYRDGKFKVVGFAKFLVQLPEGKNAPHGHTCGEYVGNPFAPGTPVPPGAPTLTLVR